MSDKGPEGGDNASGVTGADSTTGQKGPAESANATTDASRTANQDVVDGTKSSETAKITATAATGEKGPAESANATTDTSKESANATTDASKTAATADQKAATADQKAADRNTLDGAREGKAVDQADQNDATKKTTGTRDQKSADDADNASAWSETDAAKRPPLDEIRLEPGRATHILAGDSSGGGGHRHGTGRPGKSEFPEGWSDEKITDSVIDVAKQPDQRPTLQKEGDRWLVQGKRDEVDIVAIVNKDGSIRTAWPVDGPGVVKNPKVSDGRK